MSKEVLDTLHEPSLYNTVASHEPPIRFLEYA